MADADTPADAPTSPSEEAAAQLAAQATKIVTQVELATRRKVREENKQRRDEIKKRSADKAAGQRPWEIGLQVSREGAMLPWVSNGVTILRNHEDWRDILAFDALSRRTIFTAEPPLAPDDRLPPDAMYPHPLDDGDYTRVNNWLERSEYKVSLSRSDLRDSVDAAARRNTVHPIRNYFDELIWDRAERVDTWLTEYLGVRTYDCALPGSHPLPPEFECHAAPADPDDMLETMLAHRECPAHRHAEYVRLVGRYWLVSAVARATRSPCKADAMLILEGPQYLGKSMALRTLASPDWFLDSEVKIDGGKESFMQLHGKWIIEFAELAALRGADIERLKQFLSLQSDEYVPKWGRERISVPRECVFAGTCNDAKFLRDSTGGRRFWPVTAMSIDLERIAQDRDQLWAEAVHIYRGAETCQQDALRLHGPELISSMDLCQNGTPHRCHRHRWWPSPQEQETLFAPQQSARYVSDPWEDIIEEWCAADENQVFQRAAPDGSMELRITRAQVRKTILGLDAAQLPPGMGQRIEKAMGRVGFTEAQRGPRGKRARFWVRPVPSQTQGQEAPPAYGQQDLANLTDPQDF